MLSAHWDAGYDLLVIVITIITVHRALSHASHPPLLANEEFICCCLNSHRGSEGGTWRHQGTMPALQALTIVPDLSALEAEASDEAAAPQMSLVRRTHSMNTGIGVRLTCVQTPEQVTAAFL